jgi:ferric-dicitrate binding protein FerR (iron transport regulator)
VGDATHKIVPGQQISVLSFSNTVEMREVDPDLYTSWRNGVFEFRDISLLDLGYRLNKWYDVDFVFPNEKLMKLSFTGMVKKTYDIAYFLGVIEKTCNVRFEIKDSKIWVSEK